MNIFIIFLFCCAFFLNPPSYDSSYRAFFISLIQYRFCFCIIIINQIITKWYERLPLPFLAWLEINMFCKKYLFFTNFKNAKLVYRNFRWHFFQIFFLNKNVAKSKNKTDLSQFYCQKKLKRRFLKSCLIRVKC